MASSTALRRVSVSTLFSKLVNLSPVRIVSVATPSLPPCLAPSTLTLRSPTSTTRIVRSTLSANLIALSLAVATTLPVSSLMYLIHFLQQEA